MVKAGVGAIVLTLGLVAASQAFSRLHDEAPDVTLRRPILVWEQAVEPQGPAKARRIVATRRARTILQAGRLNRSLSASPPPVTSAVIRQSSLPTVAFEPPDPEPQPASPAPRKLPSKLPLSPAAVASVAEHPREAGAGSN